MAKARFDNVRRPQREIMDWNAVGQSVVKELDEAKKFREQEKAKIEELTLKAGDIISKPELGGFEPANQLTLRHANNASEMISIAYKQMKQGRISPNEYKRLVQNLADGTSLMYDVSKKYQETYNDYLERAKNGESQELEVYMREQLGKFANLKDVNTFINPNSYAVSAGLLEDFDGVMGLADRPSAHLTIAQLGAINEQKYDKLDLSKELMPEVNSIGEYIDQKIGTDKSVTEISDPKERDAFEKIEESVVNSILTNPYNKSSILTNTLVRNPDTKNRYKIAQEIPEGENREDYLLLKIDGSGRPVFEFTEKQNKQAAEMVKAKFRSMIDEKRKIVRTAPSPTSAEIKARGTGERNESVVTNVSKLYYGNEAEVTEAEDALSGLNPNISSVQRTPEGVRISYFDGRPTQDIPFTLGDEQRSQGSWVIGATNFFLPDNQKIPNVNDIVSRSGIDLNRDLSDVTVMRETSLPEAPEDIFNAYVDNLDDDLSDIFFLTETDAAVKINELIQGTGLTAEHIGSFLGDGEIVIRNRKGEEVERFDSGKPSKLELDRDVSKLKNILTSLTPPERKASFVKLRGIKPQEGEGQGQKKKVNW